MMNVRSRQSADILACDAYSNNSNYIPSHPENRLLNQVSPPRNMKQTLKSHYELYIEAPREPDSDDEISSKTHYQEMLKQIHTNEVKDYLDEREPMKNHLR